MISYAPRRALERVIEVVAAVALGGAVGFAVAQGAGLSVAGAAGVFVAAAALMLLTRIGRAGAESAERFAVVDFPDVEVLDTEDDVLLLDDPLPALEQQSRVVRLFAGEPQSADEDPAAIAAPGEMAARIADFLGAGRGGGEPARRGANAASDEANAALHAALAEIRRSLRHG